MSLTKLQEMKLRALPGFDDISPQKRGYTRQDVLAELKRVAQLLGKTPTTAEFKLHASFSRIVVSKFFGKWNAALKAAGLPVNKGTSYTKTDCLKELRRVFKLLRHTPTQKEFNRHATISARVVEYTFGGSWLGALQAAGMQLSKYQKWSRVH